MVEIVLAWLEIHKLGGVVQKKHGNVWKNECISYYQKNIVQLVQSPPPPPVFYLIHSKENPLR